MSFFKKPECDQWKNCFVNFFWTFDTVLSISEWFFERYIVWWFFDWEKKKILYILYCLLWRPYRTLGDFARFFFSLLNDKFDKKRDTLDCENLWKDAKFSYNCRWIETGDYFECNWSSMIIEWKKVDLKVSNLRWDTL